MQSLRSLLPYFRPYRKGMAWGLVLVVVAQALALANPYLLKLAIDQLAEPGTVKGDIGLLALMMVAAAVLGGAARYGMRELLNGISRRIEVDLRNNLFRHILSMDAEFFGGNRTGDLMARATNDTQAVRQAAGPAIMYAVNTVVGFVLALILMLMISPRLTAWAVVPLVLLPPSVLYFGKMIHHRFEDIQKQYSTMSTMVQESLTGMRIVRAYNQESDQQAQFSDLNEEYRARNMSLARASAAFHPLMGLMAGMGMVIVLWIGGQQVMAGVITVGDYVAFFFYLILLVWPMIALGWVISLFQRGAASMARLNTIFERAPTIAAPALSGSASLIVSAGMEAASAPMRGEIEFRGVSFTYPDTTREVLHDISFRVEPGMTVAIVGPTGSGKSTLVSLIPRLYDPSAGVVLIDGQSARDLDPAALRSAMGVVPQDPFLFSESLAGNIGLGIDLDETDGADLDERVLRAAETADLHDSIQDFPAGYNTQLGERGINLSGGQKQRATLARALARGPRLLILDDALSAVDTRTEARILNELKTAMADRTAFVVSHRVSAVMGADLILVLEDGELVERGVHADLIASDGVYARLLRRQLLEDEVDQGVVAG